LRDRMQQDALRRADLLDDIAERGELDWLRRSDERTEVHARLERMPPRSLMQVLMSAAPPPKDHPRRDARRRCSPSADATIAAAIGHGSMPIRARAVCSSQISSRALSAPPVRDDPNRAEACHDRLEPRQPPLPKRATRQRYRGTLTFGDPHPTLSRR
jgi:hypothetical protein